MVQPDFLSIFLTSFFNFTRTGINRGRITLNWNRCLSIDHQAQNISIVKFGPKSYKYTRKTPTMAYLVSFFPIFLRSTKFLVFSSHILSEMIKQQQQMHKWQRGENLHCGKENIGVQGFLPKQTKTHSCILQFAPASIHISNIAIEQNRHAQLTERLHITWRI